MYTYNIIENGYKIGVAKGRENAFKYVQKQLGYEGLTGGFWWGDRYIVDGKPVYTIERASDE